MSCLGLVEFSAPRLTLASALAAAPFTTMSGEPVKGDQLLLQPLNVLPGYLQSGRIEP